jgi:DNA-binding response OmpR family regulator
MSAPLRLPTEVADSRAPNGKTSMSRKKILIVEDNPHMQSMLGGVLDREGFDTQFAGSGEQGLELVSSWQPDLLLLDVNLPGITGFDVLRKVRDRPYLPVIMVTARDEDTSKIIGLEIGADDYVTKPFNPAELVARMRAVFRRIEALAPAARKDNTIKAGDVKLDWSAHSLAVGATSYELTATECSILRLLMENQGRIVTRESILDRVWGEDVPVGFRAMEVHISNLRKRLAASADERCRILAIRGVGYKFEA